MKNDEFHATFTLRQHTPMIHFQAEQAGALLRASELKPAFDRYLRQRVFNDRFDDCKQFLVSYTEKREAEMRAKFAMHGTLGGIQAEGECAFDYKVSIQDVGTDPMPIQPKQSYPCFFGNMGDKADDNSKKGGKWTLLIAKEDFSVCFFSLHPALLTKIRACFSLFMSRKNFGTRQSKGFGSFTVEENYTIENGYCFKIDVSQDIARHKDQWIEEYKSRQDRATGKQGIYSIINEDSIVKLEVSRIVFKHIELFWRVIRSGFNKPNTLYIKPPLFYYLMQQTRQWDKKSIKQVYFSNDLRNQQHKFPNSDILRSYNHLSVRNNYLLYRDLLGLASSVTWGRDNTIEKEHKPRSEHEKIDRFKSPITFKPVRAGNVFKVHFYFEPNDPLSEQMYDQGFAITKNGAGNMVMDTPRRQEFILERFFDYVVGNYAGRIKNFDYEDGDDSFIKVTSVNEPAELKMLKSIFKSIAKI